MNNPCVYLAQYLFLGLESLRFLAAKIKAARKILWQVQAMPLAAEGNLLRRRAKYTKEVINVGVCTFEPFTSMAMNEMSDACVGSICGSPVVEGLAGGLLYAFWPDWLQSITVRVVLARYWIIAFDTGW